MMNQKDYVLRDKILDNKEEEKRGRETEERGNGWRKKEKKSHPLVLLEDQNGPEGRCS